MARPETTEVIQFVPLRELEDQIGFLEDRAHSRSERKVVEKLRFIRLRYQGLSVTQAADMMGINHQTGYNWQRQWNEGGYGTIVPKSNPGRPSRLTEAQMRGFADLVDEGNLTTAEAAMLLRERYDIVFTNKHIAEILHSQGLRCVMAANESEEMPEGPGSRRARGCRWTRR